MLPAVAVEMPPQAPGENVLATKDTIVPEGVHEDRAPTVRPIVHQSIVDGENEAMSKRANEAIEVPKPFLERSAAGTPRRRPRRSSSSRSWFLAARRGDGGSARYVSLSRC